MFYISKLYKIVIFTSKVSNYQMVMILGELCQQPAANPLKRANKWWGFYAGIASLGKKLSYKASRHDPHRYWGTHQPMMFNEPPGYCGNAASVPTPLLLQSQVPHSRPKALGNHCKYFATSRPQRPHTSKVFKSRFLM